MTKRFAALFMAFAVLFSFAACGADNSTEETTLPDETTAPAMSEAASSENEDASSDENASALAAIYDACAEKMPEMMPLDEKMMLNYCGIKAEDCVEYYVSICADSLRTDEIWLIKAKDEAAAEKLAELADARLKAKGDESITYSPEQYEIVQKAKTVRAGDFFALIVSPDADALETIVNEGIAD